MATGEIEVVEVSLLSGRSDRPSMTFTPGTPSPTVSLGSAGQWAIAGEGVGPVHVFVTFDGQSVHVAAAVPNLPAMLAGAPVGTAWTRAPIPCELRFGGACVILRRTSRPGAFTQEEATVHDGGALWQAAQRAVQEGRPLPQQQQPQIPSMRPAAGMPIEQGQPFVPQHPTPAPAAGPVDLMATVPLADAHKFREAAMAANTARAAFDSAPTTVRQPQVIQPDPIGDMEKTVVGPRPEGAVNDPTGGFVGAPPPAMPPGPVMAGAPPPPVMPEKAPNFWQAASPVKKVTLVLMPFALIMAFLMLRDEPAPPPRVVTAGAKHALDAGTLAAAGAADGGLASLVPDAASATIALAAGSTGDAGLAANVAPDGKQDAKPDQGGSSTKVTPLTGSNRTPERAALDSVAAGTFDEAAKRYDALSSAHADDPSYKEAARILHEKAGN
jgi:hypothetical protein